MYCFICNVNCTSSIRQCLTIETSETAMSKTKYTTLIDKLIENALLKVEFVIKSTDVICETCSTILEHYDQLLTEALINQELLARQFYRNINLKYEFQDKNKLEKFDIKAGKIFAIHTDNQFICKECTFKTNYVDAISPHYRFHIIKNDITTTTTLKESSNHDDCSKIKDNVITIVENNKNIKQDIETISNITDIDVDEVTYDDSSDFDPLKEEDTDTTAYTNNIEIKLLTNNESENSNEQDTNVHDEDTENSLEKLQQTKRILDDDFLTERIPIAILNKKKITQCGICYAIFLEESKLRDHFESHKLKYKCVHCDVVNYTKTDIVEHIRNEHSNSICPQCGAHLVDTVECDHADAIKFYGESFNCSVCQQVFYTRSLFKQHTRRSHSSCTRCNEYFANQILLRDHRKKIHYKQRSQLICEICNKKFATKQSEKLHAAIHAGEYKFFCEFCPKQFMTKIRLLEHRTEHTKETLYMCEKCGLRFRHCASYRIHVKLHENPFPFKCEFCDKKFATKSHLALHRRTKHTKDRLHKCEFEYCSESFLTMWQYRRHLTKHTGIYIYNCTICFKGFNIKSEYANHLSKKHNDNSLINAKRVCEYKVILPPDQRQNV